MIRTVHNNHAINSDYVNDIKTSKHTLEKRAVRDIRQAKRQNLDNIVILSFWHLEDDHPPYVSGIIAIIKRCARYLGIDMDFFVHRTGGDASKKYLCARFNKAPEGAEE